MSPLYPKSLRCIILLPAIFVVSITGYCDAVAKKHKVMVISSYHREFIWTQETNKGLCKAMVELGYMDDEAQAEKYTLTDEIETSKIILKKLWMDSKRKRSKTELSESVAEIKAEIDYFEPDLLLLGDDNAANYIGNLYIDTTINIVFWGINGNPLNYGLLDSIEKPGRNITGVYQKSYLEESLIFMRSLMPSIKTFAILSDDSPTGRPYAKRLKRLSAEGKLPLLLISTVITNSYSEWKSEALDLSKRVDSFFIGAHYTLVDDNGKPVDPLELTSWYLKNIAKPECTPTKQMVKEGFLCTVDDSAFNQGYEAVRIMHRILAEGKKPAILPAYYPSRGPFILNHERAEQLGIELSTTVQKNLVETIIEKSLALEKYR